MSGPVFHAAWCVYRRGGPCTCESHQKVTWPNAPDPSLTICAECNDTPCSCAKRSALGKPQSWAAEAYEEQVKRWRKP